MVPNGSLQTKRSHYIGLPILWFHRLLPLPLLLPLPGTRDVFANPAGLYSLVEFCVQNLSFISNFSCTIYADIISNINAITLINLIN